MNNKKIVLVVMDGIGFSKTNIGDAIAEAATPNLDWLLSNSKLARSFSFVNTGGISYSQIKRKRTSEDQSYDYYAAYDVNNNDISLRFVNSNEDICFINSDLSIK